MKGFEKWMRNENVGSGLPQRRIPGKSLGSQGARATKTLAPSFYNHLCSINRHQPPLHSSSFQLIGPVDLTYRQDVQRSSRYVAAPEPAPMGKKTLAAH